MSEKEEPLPGTSSQQDEEAYAWVVRLSSDQRTQQDVQRFEQWLAEDEDNAARFEEGAILWDELGGLKGNPDAHAALGHLYDSGAIQDNERERWRGGRRALLGGGLAALAATVAGVAIIPEMLTRGVATYATAKGEQRRLTLADGSTVVLDTATRIEVALHDDQRLITLTQGQAFFDVARDPARPFRVFAGRDEIRALGTAFQVRFERGAARVVLEEGRVAVFRGGALKALELRAPADRLGARKADVVLQPGQATELASAKPAKVEPVDLSKTGAWRDGDLVFDDVPLSAAVAEVNRYGGREIVLGDPALARLRISGTFHTNRPETFVEGVTAALPVRLQEAGDSRLVLKEI
jgi:transmembrane sensor